MPMTSNEKRGFWRKKCRDALANHISQKLNLEIPPEKIRLQPGPEDPYIWAVTDSAKQLFACNISSLNVSTLQDICAALERGDQIEAVHRERMQERSPHKDPHDSFTATIEQLTSRNEDLELEYQQYQQKKEQELSNLRKKHSEEYERLRSEVDQWKKCAENLNQQVTAAVKAIEEQLATLSTITV